MNDAKIYELLTGSKKWLLLIAASIFVHFMGFVGVKHAPKQERPKYNTVKMAYQAKTKMETFVPQKKKLPSTKLPNQTGPKKKEVQETQKIIQGINKDQMNSTGTFSAPIGNSMGVRDEGLRVQKVESSASDFSALAKLIPESLTAPAYTEEAIDAGIEGTFVVDVYVNVEGAVLKVELRKKIGFGMDAKVVQAVENSRFTPRKNKLGTPEEGWTELKFKLVIP